MKYPGHLIVDWEN